MEAQEPLRVIQGYEAVSFLLMLPELDGKTLFLKTANPSIVRFRENNNNNEQFQHEVEASFW